MIRQKKYVMGDIIELEVFNLPLRTRELKRAKKIKDSRPVQRNLNTKNSKKYFSRLVNTNFGEHDYKLDLTFSDNDLPQNKEEARKKLKNFFARIKRHIKKNKLEKLKYVYVLSNDDNMGNKVRYHVHVLINGIDGVSDKDITRMWGHGYTKMNNLQFDEHGLTGLAYYMTNQSKGEKSWGSSQGLKKPEAIVSDKAVGQRSKNYIEQNPDDYRHIEKMYPGYAVSVVEVSSPTLINDEGEVRDFGLGPSIMIRLHKIDPQKKYNRN